MPRQIIIEIGDDGKSITLRKDETSSVFERSAILNSLAQMPDISVIPLDDPAAPQGENLSANNNQNDSRNNRPARSGVSGGNSEERNPSRKSGKQ